MTETPAPSPRPVSLVAVIAIFVLLSPFWWVADKAYLHHRPPAPQNQAPENLPKDLAWRATPADRRAYLADLREKHARQADSYGWIDKKAGVVQLPIERAMELIVKENASHP
ncbi:MAG TPA: hypothetical protein VGF85_06630 [Opitutaceae bacterium]|jgi:hypothetical protein